MQGYFLDLSMTLENNRTRESQQCICFNHRMSFRGQHERAKCANRRENVCSRRMRMRMRNCESTPTISDSLANACAVRVVVVVVVLFVAPREPQPKHQLARRDDWPSRRLKDHVPQRLRLGRALQVVQNRLRAEGAFRETEHDDDEHTQSVNRT